MISTTVPKFPGRSMVFAWILLARASRMNQVIAVKENIEQLSNLVSSLHDAALNEGLQCCRTEQAYPLSSTLYAIAMQQSIRFIYGFLARLCVLI